MLYLAYNADGSGHYGGTKELTEEAIGDEIMKSKFGFFFLVNENHY